MTLNDFIAQLNSAPDTIDFANTMAVIDNNYHFTPTRFSNGDTVSEADQNNGSCKFYAFGKMNNLSEQQTLACFGRYYREDVLANPKGNDHQNIRNFINSGWQGVQFEGKAEALGYI